MSEILGRLLSSEVKGDLLVLFHKNPGLIDTLEGVARRIGRTRSAIESDVNDLLDLGVLKRKQVGKVEVIHLSCLTQVHEHLLVKSGFQMSVTYS